MEYKSNASSVITKLLNIFNDQHLDTMRHEMAQGLLSSNLRRIHNDGKDVNNVSIGSYSIKPIYINPKRSPKSFTPEGKEPGHNVNNRKTKYFAAGYRQFKTVIGKGSKVNLQLFGTLMADFQTQRIPRGYAIGFMSDYGVKVSEVNEKR